MNYFAQTSDGPWEPLDKHLELVAHYCQRNASKFDASDFGRILGYWHDLGKYSNEFQAYLKKVGGADVHVADVFSKVDHSTAGAKFAHENEGISLLVHSNDRREKVAYDFARRTLIPTQDVSRLKNLRTEHAAKQFAPEINTDPSVVVGRLHYEQFIPFSHLNHLKSTLQWA